MATLLSGLKHRYEAVSIIFKVDFVDVFFEMFDDGGGKLDEFVGMSRMEVLRGSRAYCIVKNRI